MMNFTFYLKQFVVVLFLALVAQNSTFGDLESFETKFPAMGTDVEIIVYSSDLELVQTAFQDAQQLVAGLAAILTDYEPTSETRMLSQRATGKPVRVSDPLWDVLARASYWHARSDGSFDCSLGSLTSLWRKYRRANRVPTPEVVQQAKADTGWQQLQLLASEQSVRFDHDRIRLDFGAIGKGYIVDRIYELLQEQGLNRCLVNISGNMRVGDPPPNRQAWRIAISPLEENGPPLRRMELRQISIATSGDLWQFMLVDGVRRSHILNPKTGYGVQGPLAVTVIAPQAIDADALATIGCVQDWNTFAKLLESENSSQALRASRIDGNLSIQETDGFPPEVQ